MGFRKKTLEAENSNIDFFESDRTVPLLDEIQNCLNFLYHQLFTDKNYSNS
jgi:hypothetical protein